MRGVTLPQIIAFIVALGLLLLGVGIIATQWTVMQERVMRNTERIVAVETLQQTNEQRIANQHIRLSALETYNKDLVQSMKDVSANTKKMVDLLREHVFTGGSPDKSVEEAPPAVKNE